MQIIYFVTVLGLCFFSSAFGQEHDALFVRANEAYQENEFEDAVLFYKKILETGFESWEVYYNLGNAYYKQDNIGPAILNYERAKRIEPKNEDINYNLELAKLATVDRIETLPEFFLRRWFSDFSNMLSLQLLGLITLSLYILTIAAVILRLISKSQKFIRLSGFNIVIFVLLSVSAITFATRVYQMETRAEAIVLVRKTDVKSAPDDSGTNVFTLHAGAKLEIQDRSLDWLKIKLADGKVGWLKRQTIELI